MLAAASDVFDKMLGIGMRESESGRICIEDAPPHVVDALLQYIYTCKFPWTNSLDSCMAIQAALVDVLPVFDIDLCSSTIAALVVSGAGGKGAACNGTYIFDRMQDTRPLYKNDSGAIVYWNDMNDAWMINNEDQCGGWFYEQPRNFRSDWPPSGTWSTTGYEGGDAFPPPSVALLKVEELVENTLKLGEVAKRFMVNELACLCAHLAYCATRHSFDSLYRSDASSEDKVRMLRLLQTDIANEESAKLAASIFKGLDTKDRAAIVCSL